MTIATAAIATAAMALLIQSDLGSSSKGYFCLVLILTAAVALVELLLFIHRNPFRVTIATAAIATAAMALLIQSDLGSSSKGYFCLVLILTAAVALVELLLFYPQKPI